MKTNTLNIGDIVKYTAKFLQSTGQVTGAPKNGKVIDEPTDIDPTRFVKVLWCNGEKHTVNIANIMLARKADTTGL